MSRFSEQDSLDPDDPELDYTPLSLSERAAKLGPSVSQAARSEPIRSPSISRPASLVTEAINEPTRRTRDLDRAALLNVAARVAAVAAVVAVVALLFVIMKPASRQSIASSAPSDDTTGSTPLSNQGHVESKPALAELEAPPSQPATHEQSQQLLQRFLQWREKATATESSQ
jgi:negative regulator of sigma E activity